MENEESFSEKLNKAIEDLKEYVNLRLRLIQLNLAEKVSLALSKLITSTITFTFYILFFMFGSFALAYWLGEITGSDACGFAIIAGFYLLIAIVLGVIFKKPIRKKMTDSFISNFANEQNNEDDE